MELHTLRYFWTIAEEGTISKAASVLHITQPTLTRQLQGLEDELGTALFVRDGRRLQLTDAGWLINPNPSTVTSLRFTRLNKPKRRLIASLFSGSIKR